MVACVLFEEDLRNELNSAKREVSVPPLCGDVPVSDADCLVEVEDACLDPGIGLEFSLEFAGELKLDEPELEDDRSENLPLGGLLPVARLEPADLFDSWASTTLTFEAGSPDESSSLT